LGISYKSLDGESLIRYLLTAETDLLWLGGIGTYVKAGAEKHEEVGDRGNDNVRVDASALRAKVVGEGANLGFTQKARIEFSLLGGRINTDAVDNSAGVDTSDHEVNLKIFLTVLDKLNLLSGSQGLFEEMTQQVCRLVLANNYAQSQCLSLDQLRCSENAGLFFQVAERLEVSGFFEGAQDLFPSAKEVHNRPGKIITRPELAVLMAASKMYLTDLIQEQTALLGEPCCDAYLQTYFPQQISLKFRDELSLHPLDDKIKATVISNKLINQAGSRFLSTQFGGGKIDIMARIKAYLAFEHVLDADQLRREIESLDNQIPAAMQYCLLQKIETTMDRFCAWALSNQHSAHYESGMIASYRHYLSDYSKYFADTVCAIDETVKTCIAHYVQQGIPQNLAYKITFISGLDDFPRLADLAAKTQQDIVTVTKRYVDVTVYLGLDNVYKRLLSLPCQDDWQRRVTDDLFNTFKTVAVKVAIEMLKRSSGSCAEFFGAIKEKSVIDRYFDFIRQFNSDAFTNLYPYLVLGRQLEKVAAVL
ncbi:MAG TPA: NAD-glutamate dehydrogenase domain-containing protein, partial [Methylomicrobium sp.]|nr:NAD-glutamate dehydrogenase domain-containing protein [Methylomicrobium sp.]